MDLARRHPPAAAPRLTAAAGAPVRATSRHRAPRRRRAGGPGLITARGLELLRRADVVVHDRLIGPELLHEARAGAELVDVGKGPGHAALSQEEINQLLVDQRPRGTRRSCGSRAAIRSCSAVGARSWRRAARRGCRCEVVPGVSSAIAGPAAAGIPVTARGVARSFAVVTAHQAGEEGEHDVARSWRWTRSWC